MNHAIAILLFESVKSIYTRQVIQSTLSSTSQILGLDMFVYFVPKTLITDDNIDCGTAIGSVQKPVYITTLSPMVLPSVSAGPMSSVLGLTMTMGTSPSPSG